MVLSLIGLAVERNDGDNSLPEPVCVPHERDRIERLWRYITRPALALQRRRCSTNGAGQVGSSLRSHAVLNPIHQSAIAAMTSNGTSMRAVLPRGPRKKKQVLNPLADFAP